MTEKNDTSRLNEKYIFRNIRQEEITQAAEIEKICFRQMKHVLMNTWKNVWIKHRSFFL